MKCGNEGPQGLFYHYQFGTWVVVAPDFIDMGGHVQLCHHKGSGGIISTLPHI